MRSFAAYFLLLLFVFFGCDDDSETTNRKELITSVTVTLTPTPTTSGNVVTLTWDDTNLDAIVDEGELAVSEALKRNLAYKAVLKFFNKSTGSEVDLSAEIKKEGAHHFVCFTQTDDLNLSINYTDKDRNGQPIGLESTWTTATASTGTVSITLRHQAGVKTGDCPGYGETDVSVEFEIEIVDPV